MLSVQRPGTEATVVTGGWKGVWPVQGCWGCGVARHGPCMGIGSCGCPARGLLQVKDAVDGALQMLSERIVLRAVTREAGLVHIRGLGLASFGRGQCRCFPAGFGGALAGGRGWGFLGWWAALQDTLIQFVLHCSQFANQPTGGLIYLGR